MKNETEIPKCLEDLTSSKRVMLDCAENYILKLQEGVDENNNQKPLQLVLITNSGIIKGIPASEEEYFSKELFTQNPNDTSKVNLFPIGSLRNEVLKNYEKENPQLKIIDNGSYICLKQATYTVGNSNHTFKELIVFVDQILGFTMTI